MKKYKKLLEAATALILATSSIPTLAASAMTARIISPEYSKLSAAIGASNITWEFDGANKVLYFNGYNGTGQLTNEIYKEAIDAVYADFPVNEIECVVIGKDVLIPQNAEDETAPYNQFIASAADGMLYTYSGSNMEEQYEVFVSQMAAFWESQTEAQIREKFPLHILEDGETYQREIPEDASGVYSKGATWQYIGTKGMLYVGGTGSFTSKEFNNSLESLDVDFVVFGPKVTMCEDDKMERNGESCCRTMYYLTKNVFEADSSMGKIATFVYPNSETYSACYDVSNYVSANFAESDVDLYQFYVLSPEDQAKLSVYAETGMQMEADVLMGDVNQDGALDILDAVLLSKMASGSVTVSTAVQSCAADVNQDGTIDTNDSLLLLKFLVHLVDSL